MIHRKKILPEYYKDVVSGDKTFEIRKDEDNIQVGDFLTLEEFSEGKYSGRSTVRIVTYVLRNCPEYGLMDGYCVIGMQPLWSE